MKTLILASTSRYRQQLLERLGLPFEARPPGVIETELEGESPRDLAARLALEKAQSITVPNAVVIGSDQVPSLQDRPLRKPGNHGAALKQLAACQGRCVLFHTAVAVIDVDRQMIWQTVDETRVKFEQLPMESLDRYLKQEQPYDCAGGFKVEGLGIALFESVESADPTALVGLPLIWVARTLRQAGLDPLAAG
jgi:septum formation protein